MLLNFKPHASPYSRCANWHFLSSYLFGFNENLLYGVHSKGLVDGYVAFERIMDSLYATKRPESFTHLVEIALSTI